MSTKEARSARQRLAADLLRRRTRTDSVLRALCDRFGISESTAKRDLRAVRSKWKDVSKDRDLISAREQAIEEAEDWLRRLSITDRESPRFLPMTAARRSREIREWQGRILDLQGVSFRRVEVSTNPVPVVVEFGIPDWEEPEQEAATVTLLSG